MDKKKQTNGSQETNNISESCSNKNDSYRLDVRSKEQFHKDILEASNHERDLVSLWTKVLSKERKKVIGYRNNGCGNDGRPLEISDVSTDADFIVDDVGLVEVKFSKTVCKEFFHLKVNQVNSYLKQNATLLMVNGSMTDEPVYIIIDGAALERLKSSCKVVPFAGFGFKAAYKIPVNNYIWKKLK